MSIDLSENAEVALRLIREAKDVVYDTETSGLDWRYNAPIGYVVSECKPKGEASKSVYVPIRHGGGGNLMGGKPLMAVDGEWERHDFEIELAKAFADREMAGASLGRIIGHHIKFDMHMSYNAGIRLGRRCADTQDMEAMLDEWARSFSLADCAERRGVEAKKGEELYRHMANAFGGAPDKKIMSEYWRLPGNDPMAYDYAVGDGITTGQLYCEQIKQIEEEEMQVVWEMESDLIWTCFRMERKGIKVDLDQAEQLVDAAEQAIRDDIAFFGVGFNSRSPKMMKEAMERFGHTGWPTTDKGNPSFTEKWLKSHPEGRRVINIRQNTNLINSFVRPLQEEHTFNGRVHATLNQLKSDDYGTISGRFSCSRPNLQQVPKRNKELARPFRRLFVADEGHIFFDRDWSQAEPRLFAHYSGDENLVRGYNSKPFQDAHTVVAELLNVERDPTAKRINMGIFTGMQPRTFAGHMGWPLEQAEKMHRMWFAKFKSVKSFQDSAKRRMRKRGYVFTLLGRRCRLDEPRFAYRATSRIIQGGQADLMKYKLLQMDRICEDEGDIVQLLMTVHDAVQGQRQETPEAEKLMGELMTIFEDVQSEPFNLRVPFVAEGEDGYDWATATFGPDK